jgi:nucleoid DNA-binding protein
MTRSDLVKKVSDWRFEITPAQAKELVSLILEEIKEGVKAGGRVELRGFGRFYARSLKSQQWHHPRTRETLSFPARLVMRFKPFPSLTNRVNGKNSERRWTDAR